MFDLTPTTTVVVEEILPSARKHRVSDDDITHAISNAIAAITRHEQPEFTMLIGPTINADLLEIGVVETDEGVCWRAFRVIGTTNLRRRKRVPERWNTTV